MGGWALCMSDVAIKSSQVRSSQAILGQTAAGDAVHAVAPGSIRGHTVHTPQ
jgi:hypothetical protein